jgi:hypothetical protein
VQQGIPHLELVEPLSWNRLTRQSAFVDPKGVNEIVVFSPSPPAPPGGTEGKHSESAVPYMTFSLTDPCYDPFTAAPLLFAG